MIGILRQPNRVVAGAKLAQTGDATRGESVEDHAGAMIVL